jgi:hypothetical protein
MKRLVRGLGTGLVLAAALSLSQFGATRAQGLLPLSGHPRAICQENAALCTEVMDSLDYGHYTGHDEPSLLFYSNAAGSGNNNRYHLRLPKDPPTLPTQDGKGGTFNFQLHPAFWFGMAMCDDQSAPSPGTPCTPDSDANVKDDANPASPNYIGKHAGTAFMEMQFYPPGWVLWPGGNSCDATHWCAALNIDSLSTNMNTNVDNNAACLATVGIEPVNFAFLTMSGASHAPASPVNATLATFTPDPSADFFMNSGDELVVTLHDTPNGFQVIVRDVTTGTQGSMTASAANGFGQVKYDPAASTCTNIPHDFHPMYSTSSEHTRVPWAAHSYNVAFSDEIGHFEYCAQADAFGNCLSKGVNDPAVDDDDSFCFNAADSSRIQVGGCFGTDVEFDGVPYQTTWPGSLADRSRDARLHPKPIVFSSPTFDDGEGNRRDFSRVAFETDLPRIEFATSPPCNRTTGAGCANPPAGAAFYPIFSTREDDAGCRWQLGGANIAGTMNTFGGTSSAEYGPLLLLVYPSQDPVTLQPAPVSRYNNFRRVLSSNPCQVQE